MADSLFEFQTLPSDDRTMNWDDLRYFLALAERGSIREAGAALGVSHSTVMRRVEALEDALGTRLFDRNRDGYELTEAGERMWTRAQRVAHEMAALERETSGTDDRLAGVVRVTCLDAYVSRFLVQGLAPFCEDHPEVELFFVAEARTADLSRREADIAVRLLGAGRQPPAHLVGKRLVPVVMANYVARAHAERLDPDGAEARWISFADRDAQAPLIAASSYPDLPVWGHHSTFELLVQAAVAGVGIAMLPTYIGDREVALRRLPRPDLRHVADLWMVTHPDLRNNRRIRAVSTRIAELFHAERALFEGTHPCGTDLHHLPP